ncbi:MAG: hypothetical protein BWX44_00049 [Spirochaetes bacterium ADurb.Bin001]|nr:MAG: hypothetical protein BWX44_00049 [Spirochaetes bacterium ADurb.Bin001]
MSKKTFDNGETYAYEIIGEDEVPMCWDCRFLIVVCDFPPCCDCTGLYKDSDRSYFQPGVFDVAFAKVN